MDGQGGLHPPPLHRYRGAEAACVRRRAGRERLSRPRRALPSGARAHGFPGAGERGAMNLGRRFEFPEEQQEQRRRTARLSWLSMGLLLSTAIVVYLGLGQSEAMKTACIEDLLGLIPPIALLVALKIENREPSERFPYGYFRAVAIAFLVISSVLLMVGAWLLLDSVLKLIGGERAPVGLMSL